MCGGFSAQNWHMNDSSRSLPPPHHNENILNAFTNMPGTLTSNSTDNRYQFVQCESLINACNLSNEYVGAPDKAAIASRSQVAKQCAGIIP